jgi:ABC-type antimicrobial peptide transport system permease subunit
MVYQQALDEALCSSRLESPPRRGMAAAGGAHGVDADGASSAQESGNAGRPAMIPLIRTTDPVAFGSGAAAVVIAGIVAAYIPARRMTRVNPVSLLRAE